jgi:hypothetical protein
MGPLNFDAFEHLAALLGQRECACERCGPVRVPLGGGRWLETHVPPSRKSYLARFSRTCEASGRVRNLGHDDAAPPAHSDPRSARDP